MAVIVNNSVSTSIVFCSRRRQLLVDYCRAIVLCTLLCGLKPVAASTDECSAVRAGFLARRINVTEMLLQPTNGRHLRVCPELQRTCCSEATEGRLQQHAKQRYDATVKDSVLRIATVLNTRSQRFDDFFRTMLTNSKRDFHDMFKRTYGIIYVQNSYVFTDLFQELENYYNKGQVDLTDAMDNFFSVLYQRMFTVINSQYKFDEKYLSCVADNMKNLKPFDDVPQKLSIQIKRSFVAARTFAKALFVGAEVSRNMLGIKASLECSKSLLRMQHCAGCAGFPGSRACSNYCLNVMKGCLAYHASLDAEWNAYVTAMDKLADRLLGSFNIEMVIEPIDIKISEAIMNFQENGPDVSQRVFTGCGKPVLGKRRRSVPAPAPADHHSNLLRIKYSQPDDLQFEEVVLERSKRANSRELKFETLDFNKKNSPGGPGGPGPGPGPGPDHKDNKKNNNKVEDTLEKLIKDIRHVVRESKKFWGHLPYQICNNDEIAEKPGKDDECWNGTAVARYAHSVVEDGITNQKQNPDVFVDVNRQNAILKEQIYALKTITDKLKNAYLGMDVEWIDNEESLAPYASGSGSGDDDTSPDDDDFGSGAGAIDQTPSVVFPAAPAVPDAPLAPQLNNTRGGGGDDERRGGADGTSTSAITLARALITYLFPLVVIWFGGMFAELL